MDALEKGAIANPDENRMVGHYWLRDPELAPTPEIAARDPRDPRRRSRRSPPTSMAGRSGRRRRRSSPACCRIGIGGSALGPMFVADALGDPAHRPDAGRTSSTTPIPTGSPALSATLEGRLDETLCIVDRKSGGTPETRNGMLLVADAYKAAGLDFARHAVAITMRRLADWTRPARAEGLARPVPDVGLGRRADQRAVGRRPAARGPAGHRHRRHARRRRRLRRGDPRPRHCKNPAALLALMWYHATGGKGQKDMVVLPYKDRLLLFSRYLQQLVMESLGKRLDLDGKRVDQGITVYGNKGSTDQHAYVQQLRDGVNNFFVDLHPRARGRRVGASRSSRA